MNARTFIALSGVAAWTCFGQGTFFNSGFESATVAPVPPGEFGGNVPIADALPGWTGYVNTTPVTQVLQNNARLGTAGISILGPFSDGSVGPIIQGNYTVLLQASDGIQPGFDGFNASLAQSRTVSPLAKSIQMKISAAYPDFNSYFSVSFGGQPLSLIPIGSGLNYTLYGADVSGFAGQFGEFRLTATAVPNQSATTIYLDDIIFSAQGVPEPGTWALLTLGGALLWCGARRRRK